MKNRFSRRDFMKIIASGAAGLAFRIDNIDALFPITEFGRITAATSISVYEKPSDKSKILSQRFRDQIINIYDEIESDFGPAYNPIWYHIWGGYIHSGFVQKVQYRLNPIVKSFQRQGDLFEITVPYSQSYRLRTKGNWDKFYPLYYSSVHWIKGSREGPDGQPWYEISDSLMSLTYFVPAIHMRKITEDELKSISTQVEPSQKKIEISIDTQMLSAYEGSKVVKQSKVSTGIPYLNPDPTKTPTDTPKGKFRIHAKRPSVHMGDGTLRSDADAYELPGVPWVSYFEASTGVAIHGTYWHNNFGITMSHGCINMRSEDAKWIYRWTTPAATIKDQETEIYRTPVIVY